MYADNTHISSRSAQFIVPLEITGANIAVAFIEGAIEP
jgi:hypothetical protein